MWIENISYLITFIASAGLAAIGIMVSYQLYQSFARPVFATLLYQQIFLFSFLFYGFWGNMVLQTIIGDLNLSETVTEKLAFFVPIIGIPFMVVSWFMLLKFAFNLNAYRFKKSFIFGYFPTFVVVVFTLGLLIHKEILPIPKQADIFIVRLLLGLNLLVHVFFIFPFIKPNANTSLVKETGFEKKYAMLFVLVTMLYSAVMSFITVFGFISICISIILIFGAGIFIPVIIRLNAAKQQTTRNMDFDAFCKYFEISKREAEIVLEICSGKSNKAISEKLFITLQTVKDHNHRIFTKTGVKSRVQLANLVREKMGQQ